MSPSWEGLDEKLSWETVLFLLAFRPWNTLTPGLLLFFCEVYFQELRLGTSFLSVIWPCDYVRAILSLACLCPPFLAPPLFFCTAFPSFCPFSFASWNFQFLLPAPFIRFLGPHHLDDFGQQRLLIHWQLRAPSPALRPH